MQVNPNNNVNFTGVSARKLKGVFMTADWGGIASELKSLENKTNLKIFSLDSNFNVTCDSFLTEKQMKPQVMWAQDLFSFTDKKLFTESIYNPEVKLVEKIGKILEETFGKKHEPHDFHLQGGNHIIVDNNGKTEVLVGKYDYQTLGRKELEKRFETDAIHEIPQVAAHLDAFMFVDDMKRAFVCDDEMTINLLVKAINNLEQYIKTRISTGSMPEIQGLMMLHKKLTSMTGGFFKISKMTPYAHTNEAVQALEKAGYECVRIPARIYVLEPDGKNLQHSYGTNFANAILHKNNNGDTVLITNDSSNDFYLNLDKVMEERIGFSFKKAFIDSVSPYIKKENIHFIKGEDNSIFDVLRDFGGIHCTNSEIL